MNRAERRRIERSQSKSIAHKQYRDEVFNDGVNSGIHHAISMILYMTAYTIHNKLGFGKKRLNRIMYQIYNNIDAYNTKHLSPEDYKTIVAEVNELGYKVGK